CRRDRVRLMEVRRFAITEPGQAAEARRGGVALARDLGFDETAAGRVALVVTEAATNILKHAKDGEVLLIPVETDGGGRDVLALDRGPGIPDVGRALGDGYSTAGSSGTGLGAMRRLSTLFDVHSAPGVGTAVLARVGGGDAAPVSRIARLAIGG